MFDIPAKMCNAYAANNFAAIWHLAFIMKKLLLAAGVLAATSIPLLGASPVRAAACPGGSAQLNTLTPLAFTCDQGNFKFTLTGYTGFIGTDTISFSNSGDATFTYSVNSDTPWMSGTKTLSYTVVAPTGKRLKGYTSSLSSSQFDPKAGAYDVTGAAGIAAATLNDMVQIAGQKMYASPYTLTSDSYSASLGSITGNGIQTVQSTVATADPSTTVPGPLPILGAGAAFGFSRKLRSRIKLSA